MISPGVVITTRSPLESVTPLRALRRQIRHASSGGGNIELLIDPTLSELEALARRRPPHWVYPICARSLRVANGSSDTTVTRLVEAMGLPTVGSPAEVQAVVEDKNRAAAVMCRPAPGFAVADSNAADGMAAIEAALDKLGSPEHVIVKPSRLGGSMGITPRSVVVAEPVAIRAMVDAIERRFAPLDVGARIERYEASTREYTVGIVGNDTAVRASVAALSAPQGVHRVFSEEQKQLRYPDRVVHFEPLADPHRRARLVDVALEEFLALGLRDVARIDLIEVNGEVYAIDVNGFPAIGRGMCAEWLHGDRGARRHVFAWILHAAWSRLARSKRPAESVRRHSPARPIAATHETRLHAHAG